MAVAGVVTNVGVLMFTSDVFHFKSLTLQWTAFFVLEHGLIFFKISLSGLIPDRPTGVEDGIQWGRRIADEKVYQKCSDINLERIAKGLTFDIPENRRIVSIEDIIS